MAKVLVTGGAGFICSHVVDQFLANGDTVMALDNLSSGRAQNLPDKATLVTADIREETAKKSLKEFAPDILVHGAAQISVRVSMEDPALDADVNIRGLLNILSAFEPKKCPYLVFISTGGAIYGEQEQFPAKEDHRVAPQSVYGMSKRAGELYLDLWRREFSLEYVSLRLANVYGPRQNPHGEAGVVAVFCERLLAGKEAVINGDGTQTRDFVFVKDVARAVFSAAQKKVTGTFNIGTGIETDINEVYRVLAKTLNGVPTPKYGPARFGEQRRSVIDSGAARTAFGWEPSYTVSSGLEETACWFRDR